MKTHKIEGFDKEFLSRLYKDYSKKDADWLIDSIKAKKTRILKRNPDTLKVTREERQLRGD